MVDKTVFRFVHHLPISTCENAKVDKSGRFFRIFYFFFYFFSYTPVYLLLCNYPIFTKHPVLSAVMRFFTFLTPFFTLFDPFLLPFDPSQRFRISSHRDLVHRHKPRLNPIIPLPRGRADTPDPRLLLLYSFSF